MPTLMPREGGTFDPRILVEPTTHSYNLQLELRDMRYWISRSQKPTVAIEIRVLGEKRTVGHLMGRSDEISPCEPERLSPLDPARRL